MWLPIRVPNFFTSQDIFETPAAKQPKRVIIQYKDTSGRNYEVLKIDVTTDEEHSMLSEITKHPLASGSFIADHVIKKDDSITIHGIISDDPISIDVSPESDSRGNAANITDKPWEEMGGKNPSDTYKHTSKLISRIDTSTNRSRTAFESLRLIRENKISCEIITSLTTYTNMMLTSLTIPRSYKTVRSLKFTAKFSKIFFATSIKEPIPAWVKNADQDNSSEKTSDGQQAVLAPTEGEFNQGMSVLYRLSPLN